MKRWIGYTLGILLTLLVLAAVGGISYRMGFAQGTSSGNGPLSPAIPFGQFEHARGFEQSPDRYGRAFHDQGFNHRGFDRGRGGRLFFPPLLKLVQLAVLGTFLWLGLTLFRRSGWPFVRVNEVTGSKRASPPPTVVKKNPRKSKS